MRYYVVSDIHGFYTPLKKALEAQGFFSDTEPHKLIVCGDILDRGKESREVCKFLCELLDKDELILIRGNHEDLMEDMLKTFYENSDYIAFGNSHHNSNGTFGAALQLTGMTRTSAYLAPEVFVTNMYKTPFMKKLLPACRDFFETEHYVFVHGFLPCKHGEIDPNWRTASKEAWGISRWENGMELYFLCCMYIPDKKIVCGHWHTSYGHRKFEGKGSEFGSDADFSPLFAKGLIAIDGCTAHTGKVNCIIIED